jgi:hypothetical protein
MVSSLEERLASGSPIPWIPDPEKAQKYGHPSCQVNPLLGIAVDHFRRTNYRGDGEYDVVVLDAAGIGAVAVHCQSTVLANEMREQQPKPGERVGVRWNGNKTGSSGVEYADYTVVVEREPGGDFAWTDSSVTPPAPTPDAQQAAATPDRSPTQTPPDRDEPTAADDDEIPF